MLSIYYAKKTSNGYILNFFADSTDDVEAFNPDKSWGMYGKPIPGSVLTVTSNEEVFNYYLNESGALVEIAIDKPVEGLTPFSIGDSIVNNRTLVKFDTTIPAEQVIAFLESLEYSEFDGGAYASMLVGANLASGGKDGSSLKYVVMAMHLNNIYFLMTADGGKMAFASAPYPDAGITEAGWQFGENKLDENGEIVAYTSAESDMVVSYLNPNSNWNGTICGIVKDEPGPQPGGLTPFNDDGSQYIIGYDFGDAENSTSSDALDAFLAGLTYPADGKVLVGTDSHLCRLAAVDLSNLGVTGGGYCLIVGDTPVYSTVDVTDPKAPPISKGYQNLTDGKYNFDGAVEVTSVADVEGWNGILVGAVEGEAPEPTGLKSFSLNDEILGFDFGNVQNGQTSADLDSFLLGMSISSEDDAMLLELNSSEYLTVLQNDDVKPTAACLQFVEDGKSTPLYATEAGTFDSLVCAGGFENLSDGQYTIGGGSHTVTDINATPGWNGVLIGSFDK